MCVVPVYSITLRCSVCLTLVVLYDDMHFSLQWGETALMMASKSGHMECVKVLSDKGAEVNIQDKVSGVIHCVHVMQHVARVSSS